MKSKSLLFILSVVAVVGLVVGACAAPQPEAPQPETPPEAKEPFKIGVTASITGYAAITYGPGSDALTMYFMDVNERGGIDGREVELFIEDDRGEPPRSVSNFKAMTEKEDVDLLIGCVPSACMPGAVAEAERTNIPLIFMGCVFKWVFPPDTHPLVFTSLCNCLFDYPTIMVNIVDDYLGGEPAKIGLLGMDIPGSRLMTEMYAKLYKDLGHEPFDEYVPAGTTDLTPVALKFKDAGVEYCQFYGPGGLGPVLAKAMYKVGWEGTQLTGWWNPVEFEEETVQGTGEQFLYAGLFVPPQAGTSYHDKYRDMCDKYGYELSSQHDWGWSTGTMVEKILRETGYPATTDNLLKVMNNLEVDYRPFWGQRKYTETDHTGSWTAGRLYLYDDATGDFSAVTDWWEADTLGKTIRKVGPEL